MSELTPTQQHVRLRIIGDPSQATGSKVRIYDADTGETVENICKIVLTLEPTQVNYADVTYYTDIAGSDDKKIMKVEDPEVDVAAYVGSENYEQENKKTSQAL